MKKRDAILQAATYFFSRKGFKDTSMAELSKATGAAEGTIFYHFKNKQEIFLTILRNLRDDILPEFERYEAEKNVNTGLDMVEESISFYLYMASIKEDLFSILHQRYPYELAEGNPECRQLLESIYEVFVDIFENAIRMGQQDGSIGPWHTRKSAMILFAMVDSMVRFRMYNLYDIASLYNDMIAAGRRMLENRNPAVLKRIPDSDGVVTSDRDV
ncbi:MAG: TetR/AcrR family transcriptional regulator [Thermodesulfobacteriota bacterium]